MIAAVAALAFLAGVVVGACGLAGLACMQMAARMSRREETDVRPFDDRRPEERRR